MADFHKLRERMQSIGSLVEEMDRDEHKVLYRFLNERIHQPENFVTMLGETSSGKSSIINGLLKQPILITSARPTTGTVIEIMDSPLQEGYSFFAVNKDATLEEIDKPLFTNLSKQPDKDLARLRMVIPAFTNGLKNLRLFDTPGYGSLHDEHEEILKDFIPNSDVLIYVVSYRVGFKENDHDFMKFIEQVIGEETPFYLVVNRVPEGIGKSDARIQEIIQHAEDSLHRKLNCYIVPTVAEGVLPEAIELWHDLTEELLSPEREEALGNAFEEYQKDLLLAMKSTLERDLAMAKASEQELEELQASLNEFLQSEQVIYEKIKTTFTKLIPKFEQLVETATDTIHQELSVQVLQSNRWASKDECVGFIQSHLLPLQVRKEMIEIQSFLQVELERLDREINSILNTAVRKLEDQVVIQAPTFEPFIVNIGNRLGQKYVGKALTQYFKQYAGAAGTGAGVANAAKKGLKNFGKLFGKTYSKQTYDKIPTILKKIGATSSKALTVAAAVIVEGLFYLYDSVTWQKKLNNQLRKAIQAWGEEMVEKAVKDLKVLEKQNYDDIEEFFRDYREANEAASVQTSTSIDTKKACNQLKQIDALLSEFEVEGTVTYE